MIGGNTTIVCADNADIRVELEPAIQDWNAALSWTSFTDSEGNSGGPLEYVEPASATDSCASNTEGKEVHVFVQRVRRDNAVYWHDKQDDPQRKLFTFSDSDVNSAFHSDQYSIIALSDLATVLQSTIMRELGHVLGLTDYSTCQQLWQDASGTAADDPDFHDQHYALIYGAGDRLCRPWDQSMITERDLYEAYHVAPITGIELMGTPGLGSNGLTLQFAWYSGATQFYHNASHITVLAQNPLPRALTVGCSSSALTPT